MLEPGNGRDFAQEPLLRHGRSVLGPQDLDRHLPAMPQILREKDGGRSTPSQLALNQVAVGDRGRKLPWNHSTSVSR